MRYLILLVLLCTPGWADGPNHYSCLGVSFELPVPFTTPQESALSSAYEMYYPSGASLSYTYKLALAGLRPENADKKTEWLDLTYQALVSMRGYAPTGAYKTFLGQSVQEFSGEVRDGFSHGESLAYVVPRPDGGYLFVGLLGVRDYSRENLARLAAALSTSLRLEAPPKT